MKSAIFAAGCFWGVQYYFDQIPGVKATTVGYTGGHTEEPTYEQVCIGNTGHAEAVHVVYDPHEVSYETLARQFFRMHDPTQMNRQGPDIGDQYRSAIFYETDEQREVAMRVRDEVQDGTEKQVVTQVLPASEFYEAEDYHQKYTEKTGLGACHIPYQPIS